MKSLSNIQSSSMKKEKVDRKRPLYARPSTHRRFRKLKGNSTTDYLLNNLMDIKEEVNRRK